MNYTLHWNENQLIKIFEQRNINIGIKTDLSLITRNVLRDKISGGGGFPKSSGSGR